MDELSDRKKLTFEQAEGLEPLPSQLQLREVSDELRAVLWNGIHKHLDEASEYSDYGSSYLEKPWSTILKDEHVYRQHKMADDFVNDSEKLIRRVKVTFQTGTYADIFGWLEFVLKHPSCPPKFHQQVERSLRYCKAAYRVMDGTVICPISSEAESTSIKKAFADLASAQFNGARSHLLNAASHLTAGNL